MALYERVRAEIGDIAHPRPGAERVMVYRHQRRETNMQIFEVTGAGTPGITVFATSYDEAVRIYLAHWVSRKGDVLPDLEVKQRNTLAGHGSRGARRSTCARHQRDRPSSPRSWLAHSSPRPS